jgi:hypothetical protein
MPKINGWDLGRNITAGNESVNTQILGGTDTPTGIYDVSTTQRHALGSLLDFDDGRRFRYAHFVSAVGPGKIAAQDFSVSGFTSKDALFSNSAGTAADQAAGSTVVYLNDGAITSDDVADIFSGGYLQITDAGGEGHNYRIKSNNVGGEVETNTMKVELYDGLAVLVASEASGSIIGNEYRNLAINDANLDAIVSGITVVDMAAGEYGWVQTKGVGIVLADEAVASAGSIAAVSDGVNGAASVFGSLLTDSEDDGTFPLYPIIGIWLDEVATTEYGPVKLSIE